MRFALYTMAAGLAIAVAAEPALAYGRGGGGARGGAVRGAAVGPAGGVRTGGAARGVATGPYGGVRAGNVHGGSATGPRGTTVQHAGGAGVRVGPAGGVRAGAGGATKVTGPGGHSVVAGQGGRAAAGPAGGVAVRGGRGAAGVGPAGGVVAGGSRGGAIATPWGGVHAAGARGGVAVRPGGVGVAGGARAVGHRTGYMSPVAMRSSGYAVRTAGRYPYFNRTWYASHASAWVAPRWVAGYNLWRPLAWGSLAAYCGIAAPAVSYDYGSTIVINDDTVYVNGESVATAEEYATQATALADTGRVAKPAENDEWQPLGVFGLIQPDDEVAERIFQLAVNKAGVVRGNYYDAVADATTPVYGSLDKKTQRVAWSIGEKKEIVFEAGLQNLTKEESTVLIHYGKERTEQQMLVRIEEPKDDKK